MAQPHDSERAAKQFFSGERETYATVLLGILLRKHGVECLGWDPVTIEAEVKQQYGVDMPHTVYDQLMALINALTGDSVYRLVDVFDRTVNALTRCGAENEADIPSAEEVAWTVFELMANDPDPYDQGEKGDFPFSHDIRLYCGVVLEDEGIRHPPSTLSFATMPQRKKSSLSDSPQEFQEAYQSQGKEGESVDEFVRKHFSEMLDHLKEVGIEPAPALLEESKGLPEASPLDRMLGF